MTQGLPPQPTCRHILGGFLLFMLGCVAFFALPDVVKWGGAALTFLPGRLGLIRVVAAREVMPVDVSENPTQLTFEAGGDYALFTANYDLLVIHDAIIAAHSKPWMKITDPNGDELAVIMVERGLAPFDTPFAKGRPVARIKVPGAGTFSFAHPARQDTVYIVPDYTFGHEDSIIFWMIVQVVLAGGGLWYLLRRRSSGRRPWTFPRPTPESRAAYVRSARQEAGGRATASDRDTRPWAATPTAVTNSMSEVEPEVDVLSSLQAAQITPAQAEEEIVSAMNRAHGGTSNWGTLIGLTPFESSAYTQGASAADLAKFRYDGWPETCVKCGSAVNLQTMRWWFVRDEDGAPRLRHVECPSPAL